MATEKLSPEEKAAENAKIKMLTLKLLVESPEMRTLRGQDAEIAQTVKHGAAMRDFKSGNALDRAIEGFKIKATVADYAKSEGRKPNGEVPAPVIATVAPTVEDLTAESATA